MEAGASSVSDAAQGPLVWKAIKMPSYGSTLAPERDDVLCIGSFSDAVFNIVGSYASDDAARVVATVESIEL